MTSSAENPILVGEFEHTLDGQRRIAVPSAWRGDGRFMILPSKDFCLQLVPYEMFRENILEKAKKLSLASSRDARDLAILGSRAQECICDKQGRIQLSPKLAEHAGLHDKVLLIGAFSYGQLWSPERWKANDINDNDCYDVLEKINNITG